jgi:hypothetical protein
LTDLDHDNVQFPNHCPLAEQTSHTVELTRITEKLIHPGTAVEKSSQESHQVFRGVLKTLLIAHGRVYLLGQEEYRPYLTSAYVEAASIAPQKLHLVRSVPQNMVP